MEYDGRGGEFLAAPPFAHRLAWPIRSVSRESAGIRYEQELLRSIKANHKDLLDGIRKEKALTPDLEGKLKSILESFTKSFA